MELYKKIINEATLYCKEETNDKQSKSKSSSSKKKDISALFADVCIRYYDELQEEDMPDVTNDVNTTISYRKHFVKLASELNRFAFFAPTKIAFCQFANITSYDYSMIAKSVAGNSYTRQQFLMIEDFIVNTLRSLALNKNISERALSQMLQTVGDSGHNQATSATVAIMVNRAAQQEQNEAERLQALKYMKTLQVKE